MISAFSVWMISIAIFFGLVVVFGDILMCHKKEYRKIGSIIAALGILLLGISCALGFIALGYSQPYVAETKTIDIIYLPDASVELIAENDKLTEVRVVESLGNAVGLRTYTNIQWDKTKNTLSTLVIKKDVIEDRFGIFVTDVKERTLALLS